MHAFAPVDLDLLGFALVHHVRGFGISGKRHLAAGDGNGLLVGLALIGELVHLYAGEVLPAVRQRPGGGAALGVPVVELLLGILDQLAGEGIPHPRQQVGLVASGAAIACGDHTGCDLHAVEGDGALAVGCARGVVGTTGDYYNVAVGILQGNLLVAVVRVRVGHGSGIAIVGGQQRVVDPAGHLEVLDELSGHIMGVQVLDVGGIVVAALPAFEVLHVVAAEQRGVGSAAVLRVVANPAVLLVVAQEAHHFGVLALGGVAAVGQISCPVLEGGVVLVAGTPFGGHTPAVVVDHLAHLAGFPRIFRTGRSQVAPHIEVDEVHVVADFLAEVSETAYTRTGCQIVDTVDADTLIKPVPAVAQAACRVAAHHVLAEGLGFRIHFGGVDVHTEASAILGALFHHGVHVVGAAETLADIAVVRVAGVVAFIAVALEQHGLAEAVGVQGHLLDVVKRGEERVLRLGAEVHGDTPCHQFGNFLGLVRVVHDVAVGDCAILPVDGTVFVLVAGDGHGHLRQSGFGHGVLLALGIGDRAVVVPRSAGQAQGGGVTSLLGGGVDTRVLAAAAHRSRHIGAIVLGVAPQAGTQASTGDEAVGVVAIGDVSIFGHCEVGIARLLRVGRHTSTSELGIFLAGTHGNETLVREGQRLDGVLLHTVALRNAFGQVVLDLGDVEVQLVGLDRDLNGDHRVNLLGLILDLQRVGGLGVGNLLEGHVVIAQFDVGAVDFNGAHILGLAVHHLAVGHRVLQHRGEVLLNLNFHLLGLQRFGGDLNGFVQGDGIDGKIRAGDRHLLGDVLIAFLGNRKRVFAFFNVGEGEGAICTGLHLGLIQTHCCAFNGSASSVHNLAGNRVLGGFDNLREVLDVHVGDLVQLLPGAGLDGKLVGEVRHCGVIDIECLLAIHGQCGDLGVGPGDLNVVLFVGARSSDTSTAVPAAATATGVGLPEPAVRIVADEQAAARVVVAQVEAEAVGGAFLRGFDGGVEGAGLGEVVICAPYGYCRPVVAGAGVRCRITVRGSGLEVQPTVCHLQDFVALSDVGINSPAFNRIGLCGRSLGSSCRIRSIVDLLNLTCQSLQVSIRQGHCERSTSPAAHAG